ncbi:MAG: cupin domain-containing protein [Solirubrobacteraceae bacterium]
MSTVAAKVLILDGSDGPELPLVEGAGAARAIVWPGMGAKARSLHHIWLAPDARTVPQRHSGEAVYYVVNGDGIVFDSTADERQPLREGGMFHIDGGTEYVVEAGERGIELVGGPAPADPALYEGMD